MQNAEDLMDSIAAILGEHGVSKYMIAIDDPDSDQDMCLASGHAAWQVGVSVLHFVSAIKRVWDSPDHKDVE